MAPNKQHFENQSAIDLSNDKFEGEPLYCDSYFDKDS